MDAAKLRKLVTASWLKSRPELETVGLNKQQPTTYGQLIVVGVVDATSS